jgi:hypothetical protein
MKRIMVFLLCICILLAGCQKNADTDNKQTTADTERDDSDKKEPEEITKDDGKEDTPKEDDAALVDNSGSSNNSTIPFLKLNTKWSGAKTVGLAADLYTKLDYEAKVKPYTIKADLSNIDNIDQFSGFTEEQKNMLAQNGFVVLPSKNTRMYYVYDSNEYQGVPNFVTTDSVLHLYHQFYDKSLLSIETDYLYKDLELMTEQMLDKSLQLYDVLVDEDLKALQKKNIIYFLVARMTMLKTSQLNVNVPEELLETAKKEYALIDKAEAFEKSPLLGVDFDYSQFKVRGHYTKSEELGNFFRTMMWFGTCPISLMNEFKEVEYENTLQALLIAFTTFLDTENTCDAELWSNIYLPTEQYVGASDDINVFTMNSLRLTVFGDSNDPNIFHEESYRDKLIEAVKALPEPKIQGELTSLSAPTGKQFRYMGQRYILDSYVMQNLTDSILRPIPSALDVMGVLGSKTAENLLFNKYKPQKNWPKYEEIYQKLKNEVGGYTPESWGSNLYNGWLWSIQENLTEFDAKSGMPYFMTTKAWKSKSLNTALGSYTELKHDTVLYGKQAVAEAGDVYETADYHYVEPNVELYHKLLYLTDFTIQVLQERKMLNDNFLEGANLYKELLVFLIDCSEKELRNEALTEEENKMLLYYGGKLENISISYLMGLSGDYDSKEISDMLVSDVATYENSYLSLGTGYYDNIYVVVPIGGKLYLSRGAVYSHYEFVSDTRLTDEEWWELQGITINHEEYGDYPEFTEISEDLPAQPDWVKDFKTDTNEVEIEPLEINWEEYE